MNELGKFQLRLVTRQTAVPTFEHASVALLARYKVKSQLATNLPIRSEWRDPIAVRHNSNVQGVRHHG